VGLPTAIFLAAVCLLFPAAAISTARAAAKTGVLPPRRHLWVSALVTHAILLIVSLAAARDVGIVLFERPTVDPAAIGGAAAVVAAVVAVGPWSLRRQPLALRRRIRRIVPATPADLPLWLALSVSAGVVEEIAYRGVLFRLLSQWTPGWWIPALLGAALFAAVHAIQGWRGMLGVAAVSLAMQALVWKTDDLYTAMAAHTAIDIGAGLVMGRPWRRTRRAARVTPRA
jgi:membrane protease YdiL (CAAX protease family)